MKLKIVRKEITETSTIGELFINDKFFCYTLEDKDRNLENGGSKVYGKTAIPRGSYEIVVTYSNRFKQQMPLLLNVPQFEGVRIHTGNTSENTEGCLLVGKQKKKNFVGLSRLAYSELFRQITKAIKNEKVFIDII